MAEPKPQAEPTEQPSTAQAMEIAQAALVAAEEAKSASAAKPAMKDAMTEEAEAQGVKLDPEVIDAIAAATIAQIEARGGFEPPPTPPQAGPDPNLPPQPDPALAQPQDGAEPPQPPAAEHVADRAPEEAPKSKSWAERFQGKSAE